MAALGQSRRFGRVATTSGLAPAADVPGAIVIFDFGPGADLVPSPEELFQPRCLLCRGPDYRDNK